MERANINYSKEELKDWLDRGKKDFIKNGSTSWQKLILIEFVRLLHEVTDPNINLDSVYQEAVASIEEGFGHIELFKQWKAKGLGLPAKDIEKARHYHSAVLKEFFFLIMETDLGLDKLEEMWGMAAYTVLERDVYPLISH